MPVVESIFYVTYYLPGVKKKVARPLYCKKSEAKEFMFIHERRLMNLHFDDFDIKKNSRDVSRGFD